MADEWYFLKQRITKPAGVARLATLLLRLQDWCLNDLIGGGLFVRVGLNGVERLWRRLMRMGVIVA